MPFLMMQEKTAVLQHQKCMVPIIMCEDINTESFTPHIIRTIDYISNINYMTKTFFYM